jgi:hypothetical protein
MKVKTWFQSLLSNGSTCTATLRWLSFWDENNYNPEDFQGWANFGFTANVTRIIAGARLGLTHLLKAGLSKMNPVKTHSLQAPGFNP